MARKKFNKVKTKSIPKSNKIQYSSDLDALKSFLNITPKDIKEYEASCAKEPFDYAGAWYKPSTADVKPKMPFLDSFYDLRNWIMVAALLILAVGVIFNDSLMIILSLVVFFGWAMLVADFLHYNKRDR